MDQKIVILYVDDEYINLKTFKKTFRREFEIHTALSAKEALDVLSSIKVDIVITDYRMPEITGTEFLMKISDRYPHIPPYRLMISGFYEKDKVEEAMKIYHLYKFIAKPWKEEDLRETILSVMKHS